MSAKFPRGGGAGPFLARSLYCFRKVSVAEKACPVVYVIVIPWVVRLYVEIIHEL